MIQKQPGEKLGISIRGGAKGHAGNPFDSTDEGIFISKVLQLLCRTTMQFNISHGLFTTFEEIEIHLLAFDALRHWLDRKSSQITLFKATSPQT